MIVVSDASPLNYLVLLDAVYVLPKLYDQVYVPRRVLDELRYEDAAQAVRDWVARPPDWLIVQSPTASDPDPRLHPGEADAIALAIQIHADRVLIDERIGREVARRRGLHVIGLLGLLDEAAERQLISLEPMLDALLQTSFRVHPALIAWMRERDAQRRHS